MQKGARRHQNGAKRQKKPLQTAPMQNAAKRRQINAQRSKSRAGVLSLEWEGGLAEHLALFTRALVATALMGWL